MPMKDEINYYLKIIKPIEKKYNRMCFYYRTFKLPYFLKKKKFYNGLLLSYYKTLTDKDLNILANFLD